jgi:hypothetical protein
MRRNRNMVEVEPDLPKPSTQPPALLHGAADGFFVERGLPAGGVEVDYAEETIFRREDIIYAIKECVKTWYLQYDMISIGIIYSSHSH